ncbi:potassium translocating ATPase, subunit C [Candidatus Sulfobium mesophilum]|uniref:Potassium-transporting ATPase KdpC subunit n=1 Tax=Candidatus Sulfobium mesophilum TaxID=2016548 RepID=A0A2U3QJB2_9BACT|nr:potassium translocating ATPase, subunit C [Candidatus Sulfobium mesophilum]
MLTTIRNAFMSLLVFTILTGLVYPVAVTAIAQVLFPDQANGSILMKEGKPVGSTLIGQQFDDPKYFWGRISATGPFPYNGDSSSGSNLGSNNPALLKAVKERIAALHAADPGNTLNIPVDLVTASGSGLDPHISPAAAAYQVQRVALARGIETAIVGALVAANTEDRQFGILGEPRVNVLRLNLALDELGQK